MIKDHFKYVLEIDEKGQLIDWRTNYKKAINVIAVMYNRQLLFEIGFRGVRPYARSRSSGTEIQSRKYIGLNQKQYGNINSFLFLFLNTMTVVRTESNNVYHHDGYKTSCYPLRKYSVDKRDEFFIADLMYIECYKNKKFLKRIGKIVHSINGLSKLRSQAKIIERLQLILQPDYPLNIQLIPLHILLIHLLNNQTISRFHDLIQYVIFNHLHYNISEYTTKKKLIESSTHPNIDLQIRIVKEYRDYITFEIFNQ